MFRGTAVLCAGFADRRSRAHPRPQFGHPGAPILLAVPADGSLCRSRRGSSSYREESTHGRNHWGSARPVRGAGRPGHRRQPPALVRRTGRAVPRRRPDRDRQRPGRLRPGVGAALPAVHRHRGRPGPAGRSSRSASPTEPNIEVRQMLLPHHERRRLQRRGLVQRAGAHRGPRRRAAQHARPGPARRRRRAHRAGVPVRDGPGRHRHRPRPPLHQEDAAARR